MSWEGICKSKKCMWGFSGIVDNIINYCYRDLMHASSHRDFMKLDFANQ